MSRSLRRVLSSARVSLRTCTAAAILFGASSAVFSASLTWDPAGTNGVNTGGPGTWDLSSNSWYNGAADVAWTDITGVDSAIFDGFSSGTVNLGTSLAANNLTFSLSGYSITGANTLTLAGTTPTITDTPLLVGNSTIAVPVSIGAAQTWTIGSGSSLTVSGNLTGSSQISKAGFGMLTLSGNNSGFSGTINVSTNGGQLNINSPNALGTGTFSFGVNALVISNTSGAAVVNAGNNAIAMNASNTFNLPNDLNLGTGTVTFGANRAPVINGGTLTLGTLAGGANSLTKAGSGTLVINNASNVYGATSVTGGILDLGTLGVMGGSTQNLSLGGGELKMTGTAAGARTQSVNAFTPNTGRDTLTLIADPAQNISLVAASLGTRGYGATGIFRGANLGVNSIASASAGAANVAFTAAPTPSATIAAATGYAALGTGVSGSTQAAVFRGILADTSATGNGIGFATYDAANGVRLLNPTTEQTTTYPAASSNDNVLLSLVGATPITGVTTNTLQLDNVSGSTQTVTNTGSALFPANGLLFSGNSPITLTGGTLTEVFGASVADGVILSTNSAGVTIASALTTSGSAQRGFTFGGPGNIQINGALGGQASNGGVQFNGPGTVTLNSAVTTSSNGIVVQGGTVKLASGFSMVTSRNVQVAPNATIDLNGTNFLNAEAVQEGNLGSNTAAGVITNSSATPATFTITKGSNATTNRSSVVTFTGNLNFTMNTIVGATGVQTLGGQSTYTGTTNILSGNIALSNNNVFPVGTAMTVDGGGLTPAVVNLASFSQTVASLAGSGAATAGTITNNTNATTSVLTINGGSGTTYSGLLANGGTGLLALAKTGAGTQSIAGANTYAGGTVVAGGLLSLINTTGSATGTGPVTAFGGGTLGGNGFIVTANNAGATVGGGGKLSPGVTTGTLSMDLGTGALNISGADLASNSQSMLFDLDTPGTSDQVKLVNAASSLNIGSGTLEFNDFVFTPTANFTSGQYTLFDTSNAITGSLGSNLSGTVNGLPATLVLADGGHDVVLNVTAVPEPASMVLMGFGAAGLALAAYRRRKTA